MTAMILHSLLNHNEKNQFSHIWCKCIHLQLYLNIEDISKQFEEETGLPETNPTSFFLSAVY
jgi:hypothetical protein